MALGVGRLAARERLTSRAPRAPPAVARTCASARSSGRHDPAGRAHDPDRGDGARRGARRHVDADHRQTELELVDRARVTVAADALDLRAEARAVDDRVLGVTLEGAGRRAVARGARRRAAHTRACR